MTVASTTIAEALDASETGVDVTDVLGFPSSGDYTARVDSEWMRVAGGQGTTTWTVTRGYASTTAATHDSGTAIYHVPDTYPDLDRIKRATLGDSDTATTDHDDVLVDYVNAVHSWMVSYLGMFLGPTTLTQVDVDGLDALEDRHVLWFPFGIQSLTTLSVASETGGTLETVDSDDYILLPRAWEPKVDPDQPYTRIRFKDVVTGDWSRFPKGMENVRIAGTLGWANPPYVLGEIGDRTVIRMFQARQTGQRDLLGSDEMGAPIVSRFVSAEDRNRMRAFMGLISTHRTTPRD